MSLVLPELLLNEFEGSKPIAVDSLEPVTVARHWSQDKNRCHVVLLDSALRQLQGRSVVTVDPRKIIKGSLWKDAGEPLREELRLRTQSGGSGGLFGWVGYSGDYVFGSYDHAWSYDHISGRWINGSPPLRLEKTEDSSKSLDFGRLCFRPKMQKHQFCERVERVLEYIAAGDIYQVNLAYPWKADWPSGKNAWGFYEKLRSISPAPHGAYFDLDGIQVCGASPECFLKMDGRGIVTRPIKGTRPRGTDAVSDEHQARELLGSAKERAELVMITDLLRNDLGKVCEFGSVQVKGWCELERYAQVQHLVSTVEGQLRPEIDHVEALLQCFPGGSISGAPKKRAMEIIAELEPFERGIYTGAMGYFGFDGTSQFNIVIRTAWVEGDEMTFYTGAGIVADSVPEREWEETHHKAAGLLRTAEGSSQY